MTVQQLTNFKNITLALTTAELYTNKNLQETNDQHSACVMCGAYVWCLWARCQCGVCEKYKIIFIYYFRGLCVRSVDAVKVKRSVLTPVGKILH